MSEQVSDEFVTQVARDLVAGVAPEELPLFGVTSAVYLEDPKGALKASGEREEMLGFGVGEAVVLLTPIALAVSADVLRYLRDQMSKSMASQASGVIDDLVSRLFKRVRAEKPNDDHPPPLSREQLVEVRRLAFEKARAMRLSKERADLLADSMVGSLAAG